MGPDGVFFQTIHGICLLRRDHSVQPIGEPVRALMDTYPVVTSAVLVASERQVRFTATNAAQTAGRILVYDYRIGQWFEWEIQVNPEGTHVVPVSAAHIDDIYYILRSDGVVWWEDVSTHYDNTTYYVPMIVETGDIQPAGPNQWMHVREASVLCEWKDDHRFTASVYYNHNSTIDDTATWSAAEVLLLADAADREQFSYTPPTQKLQAIRFRFESAADGTPVNGQGFEIHSLGLEVALTGRLPQDGQQARK